MTDEAEPFVERMNDVTGMNLFIIAFWVTRCSSHRLDCIAYLPSRDTCFRIHNCLALLKGRTISLDIDAPGMEVPEAKYMR